MISFFRFIIFLLSILVIALAVIYYAATQVDVQVYKDLVAEKVEDITGRDLTVEGEVEIRPGFVPRLVAKQVILANRDNGVYPYFAKVERLEATLELESLLSGVASIETIRLVNPTLFLEKAVDEPGNWKFKKRARNVSPPKWRINQLEIDNGKIEYLDIDKKRKFNASVFSLTASADATQRINAKLNGAFQGLPLQAEGVLDDFSSLFTLDNTDISIDGSWNNSPLRIEGTVGRLISADDVELDVKLTNLQTATLVEAFDVNIPKQGKGDISARLRGQPENYWLENIDIELESTWLSGQASGELLNLTKSRDLTLDVDVSTASVADLLKHYKQKFALPAKANLRGIFHGKRQDFSLDITQLKLHHDDWLVAARGSIKNLNRLQQLDLDCELNVSSLSAFSALFDKSLPTTEPIQATANLSRDKGPFALRDIDSHLIGDDFSFNVKGHVADLARFNGVELSSIVDAQSLNAISGFTDQPLPLSQPFTLEMDLRNSDHAIGWNVDATLNSEDINATLNGNIENIAALQGLDLDVGIETTSLDEIAILVNKPLPPIRNVKAVGKIKDIPDTDNAFQVTADMSAIGLSATFGGQINLHESNNSVDAQITLMAPAANSVERLLNIDLPVSGAVAMSSQLVTHQTGFSLNSLTINLPLSKLGGALEFTFSNSDNKPLQIRGNIDSTNLDVTEFLHRDEEKQATKHFFSREPFSLAGLKGKDIELVVEADRFQTHWAVIRKVRTDFLAANGKLEISNLSAHVGLNGLLELHLGVDTQQKLPTLTFQLSTEKLNPADLVWFRSGELIQRGSLGVEIALSGRGVSLHDIMADANGQILIDLDDTHLQQTGIRLVGADIATQIIREINPFSKKKRDMKIFCGVIGFNLQDGIARTGKGIAIQARDITILGGGSINFDSEKIDIEIYPKARKGFGLGATSLAKFVRLGGKMSAPKIEADPKGLVKSGAAIGAAVASGGVSLLVQGLYDRIKAGGNVCASARDALLEETQNLSKQGKSGKKYLGIFNATSEKKSTNQELQPELIR